MGELKHSLTQSLNSRQRELLSLNTQDDWLQNYVQKSYSVRAIHRWNFLQPFTDVSFSIEPLNSIFNRYLEYLHYCRFHNPEPIVHIDSQLLWMLWNCQNKVYQFPELSRSALQLFCGFSEIEPKISFFKDNELSLKLDGLIYNLQVEQSMQGDILKLSGHAQSLKIFLDRNLSNYRKGLRERCKKNINFTTALIPHNEDPNTVRSLYNLPAIVDCKFNEQQVAFYLDIDRTKLSQIQKTLLEVAYFEEWQFINETLSFPSQKTTEKPTSVVQIFDRKISRDYFCWIEDSTDDPSKSLNNLDSHQTSPGVHLHNASDYLLNDMEGNMLNAFMQRFKSHGTGQFLDSVLPELLNELDQSVQKWSSETASYENPWNYFVRIASILWRKALISPMTVHLDLTSRCNTTCSFCGYHSPLIKDRVWAHSGWQTLDLDFQVYTDLRQDLAKTGGADEVLLIGGGEPILHKHSSNIIQSLSSSGMNPYLFTNGLVINEEQSRNLLEAGLFKFYWSIHAADEDTWIALHPGASHGQFKRVIQNLKRFIEIKKELQAGTRVIVIHALCKQNYTQIESMITQARDLGVDELRFQLMQPVCSELHEQLPNQKELVWMKQTFDQLLHNKIQGNMTVEANINWQLERKEERLVRDSPEIKSGVWKKSAKPTKLPKPIQLENRLNNPSNTILKNSRGSRIRKRCYAGYFVLRNFVDGRLSYCFHDRIVGDLKVASFSEIWNSTAYQELRDRALKMDATQNVNLWDGHKGNWLVAEDCASCSNYEMQTRVEHTLRKTGWWIYLHPESM